MIVNDIKLSLKVGIIGAGQVGATFAYALLMRGLASEIGSSCSPASQHLPVATAEERSGEGLCLGQLWPCRRADLDGRDAADGPPAAWRQHSRGRESLCR